MTLLRPSPTEEELRAAQAEIPIGSELPDWVTQPFIDILHNANLVQREFGLSPGETVSALLSAAFVLGVVAERHGWDTDLRGIGHE